MKTRGRPRHPDILTPREWEVLTLIREGLTNPQIAERLGITLDAAKYHVSEILTKLNLRSRAQAADWRPEPAPQPVFRPGWANALGRWWPLIARVAGATVVAAAVGGLGVLAYTVLKNEGNDGNEIAQGTATPGPSQTPDPESGIDAIALEVAPGTEVPIDMAMIIETGCWGCDGPTTGLIRVYRNIAGETVTDTLFTPATVGLEPITIQTNKGPEQRGPTIFGYAVAPGASEIVVGVSYGLGLGPPDQETMLYRSVDGGISWQDYGTLDIGDFLTGDIVDGQVIVGRYQIPEGDKPETPNPSATPSGSAVTYRLFPSGELIGTLPTANFAWAPQLAADGSIIWRTDDGHLVSATGEPIASVDGTISYTESSPGAGTAISWYTDYDATAANAYKTYIDVLADDGASSATYQAPEGAVLGPWLDRSSLFVNMYFPIETTPATGPQPLNFFPAIVYLEKNRVEPIIHPFSDDDFPNGRNLVAAVQVGPLLRVTGTDSCLNIRSEASTDAGSLECTADNVLLKLVPTDDTPDGWLRVTTPAGNEGWASTDFLERLGADG